MLQSVVTYQLAPCGVICGDSSAGTMAVCDTISVSWNSQSSHNEQTAESVFDNQQKKTNSFSQKNLCPKHRTIIHVITCTLHTVYFIDSFETFNRFYHFHLNKLIVSAAPLVIVIIGT